MKAYILIFGTFNPLTLGHIRMGEAAAEMFDDPEVIYIPSKNSFLMSWKQMEGGSILDGEKRLALMREALAEYGFSVDDLEISTDISGKTYDTVAAIKQKNNTENVWICMGTDKVYELYSWYRGEELVKENHFLILDRAGERLEDVVEKTELTARYRDNFTAIANRKFTNVSSSIIRRAYVDGKLWRVREYLPANVYKYLEENEGVYK